MFTFATAQRACGLPLCPLFSARLHRGLTVPVLECPVSWITPACVGWRVLILNEILPVVGPSRTSPGIQLCNAGLALLSGLLPLGSTVELHHAVLIIEFAIRLQFDRG
ncbi:hypothetical protein AOLI_G00025080 [Acnodon oligacanthus]